MQTLAADLVLDSRAELGEGPIWDARSSELLWVDIMAGNVHRFDPATGADRALDVGQPVGAIVPRASGGYALAIRDGFATCSEDGVVRPIARLDNAARGLRMNDGACDSAGRFWAGSMHLEERDGAGTLYRLDSDGAVTTILTGVTISNGIGWSPDDLVMYYVDTPTSGIDAFDFDARAGSISNRRRVATIEDGAGFPDGLVVDAEGCCWVALWEGWSVRRYAPDGELLAVVNVPAARVTKPAFGGPALDRLFVTTAAPDSPDPAQPHAGGIFAAEPGVRGQPSPSYAG
jgi:sugar lactone lactonase YvrE